MVKVKEINKGKQVLFRDLKVGDMFKFLGNKFIAMSCNSMYVRAYDLDEYDTNEFLSNAENVLLLMRDGEEIVSECEVKTKEVEDMNNLQVGDIFKFGSSDYNVYLGKSTKNGHVCMNLETGKVSDNWGTYIFTYNVVLDKSQLDITFESRDDIGKWF